MSLFSYKLTKNRPVSLFSYVNLKKFDKIVFLLFVFKNDNISPDPDPNWAKILDPDPNSMYLDPQH